MNTLNHLERRKFPRFNILVLLNLSFPGAKKDEIFSATSINISMNGIYCQVNRYIPVFEKVLVMFVIPQSGRKSYNLVLQCEAVVVRVEPEHEEPGQREYNIALYFHNLSQAERIKLRALISAYISTLTPDTA